MVLIRFIQQSYFFHLFLFRPIGQYPVPVYEIADSVCEYFGGSYSANGRSIGSSGISRFVFCSGSGSFVLKMSGISANILLFLAWAKRQ